MPLTVADLLKTPGLTLRPAAGRAGLSNAIRWVHVSELEDPTPWLKGGELLLTTGMGVGATPARQRAYVRRLIEAGLAGLGFGLGFSHQKVPKALVDTAEQASFPVFEVPYVLPFIAITEAVFTRLVAEQYDLLQRSLEAEHTLTRAVLDGRGVSGIVAALTRAIDGWAILLDLHGAVIAIEPDSAGGFVKRLWTELQSSRPEGPRFSLSLVDRGQNIAIQPVSAQGRVEAYLSVGKKEALGQFDRIVVSHALSLLALELTKVRAVSETERRLRGDVLEQILAGTLGPAEARRTLDRLGFALDRPVMVVAFAGDVPPEAMARACEEALARQFEAFLALGREDHVLVVVQPEAPGFLAGLRASVAERTTGAVMAGAGSPVPHEQLLQGVREARYALQVCRTESRPQAEFADLGTYQLLLSLQDPDALRTFASSVLAPLDDYDEAHGGHLIPSLRAFLERNARWEAAASDLYVHRHTLRYRMRKVEELTGRDLASARDRMELFLALRARDLLTSGDWPEAPAPEPLARTYKQAGRVAPSESRRSGRKG
ncbi:MAG TPA: PucR family transcriptional regulator ligand-binding domain-containing protein [Actinomycetota bacterium]